MSNFGFRSAICSFLICFTSLVAGATVTIEQGTFSYVPHGEEIDLGGFGPCRALVIYDKSNGDAVAAHLDEVDTYQLAMMISFAKERLGDLKSLEVHMSGAHSMLTTAKERQAVLMEFFKAGLKEENMFIRWLPGASLGSMRFDTSLGVAYLSVYSLKIVDQALQDIPYVVPTPKGFCARALAAFGRHKFSEDEYEILIQ